MLPKWIHLTEVSYGTVEPQSIVVSVDQINVLRQSTYNQTPCTQINLQGDCLMVKENIETVLNMIAGG